MKLSKILSTPAQDEENEVSYFDSFDDALFYDSENEEGTEPLDEPDPLCLKTEDVEEIFHLMMISKYLKLLIRKD
jgi:hypothetical protein